MDRPEPSGQSPEERLRAEFRSSLLLLCILLGPILALVVIVHQHDHQVIAHRGCVPAREGRPACSATPTTTGP